jgi:hypothetical protein
MRSRCRDAGPTPSSGPPAFSCKAIEFSRHARSGSPDTTSRYSREWNPRRPATVSRVRHQSTRGSSPRSRAARVTQARSRAATPLPPLVASAGLRNRQGCCSRYLRDQCGFELACLLSVVPLPRKGRKEPRRERGAHNRQNDGRGDANPRPSPLLSGAGASGLLKSRPPLSVEPSARECEVAPSEALSDLPQRSKMNRWSLQYGASW